MAFFIGGASEHVRLKSYGANVKGPTATLTVTLEVSDTFELSYLLRSLEQLKADQDTAARNRKAAKAGKPARKTAQIEHAPLLALPPPRRSAGEGI